MLHGDSQNYNLQTSWPITMQDAAKAVEELGLGCTHHSYYRLWTVYCWVYVGTSNVYHETLLKRCGDGWCGERTPGTGQRSSSKGSWNAGTCKDLPGSRSKPPSSKAGTIPLRSGLKAIPECLHMSCRGMRHLETRCWCSLLWDVLRPTRCEGGAGWWFAVLSKLYSCARLLRSYQRRTWFAHMQETNWESTLMT